MTSVGADDARHTFSNPPYDVQKDFTPLAMILRTFCFMEGPINHSLPSTAKIPSSGPSAEDAPTF